MTWHPYLPEPRPAITLEPDDPEPVPLDALRLARDLCRGFRTPPRQFRRRTAKRTTGTYYAASDMVTVDPDRADADGMGGDDGYYASESSRSDDDGRLLAPWICRGGGHRHVRAEDPAVGNRVRRRCNRLVHDPFRASGGSASSAGSRLLDTGIAERPRDQPDGRVEAQPRSDIRLTQRRDAVIHLRFHATSDSQSRRSATPPHPPRGGQGHGAQARGPDTRGLGCDPPRARARTRDRSPARP